MAVRGRAGAMATELIDHLGRNVRRPPNVNYLEPDTFAVCRRKPSMNPSGQSAAIYLLTTKPWHKPPACRFERNRRGTHCVQLKPPAIEGRGFDSNRTAGWSIWTNAGDYTRTLEEFRGTSGGLCIGQSRPPSNLVSVLAELQRQLCIVQRTDSFL